MLQTKADVNQIHFSWILLFQSPQSVVSAYMALFFTFSLKIQRFSNIRDLQREKKSWQNLSFGGRQSFPPPCRLFAKFTWKSRKSEPCSGPLVKVIISLSACTASSLTTFLKSINEKRLLGFQRPLASMNDPRTRKSARKQIISARIFLGITDWTILNSIKLITYYLIIRFLRRSSLVQSVTPRWIRAKIICLRVDFLALGVIHACDWDNWCPPELFFALKVACDW